MKTLNFLFFQLICITSIFGAFEPTVGWPLWIRGDYISWVMKEDHLSTPLLTSGSFLDPIPGAIGQPGTKVLLGEEGFSSRWRNGFQIGAGTRLFDMNNIGIEADYILLPKVAKQQSFKTSGEPGSANIAVPIFDVTGLWGLNGVPGETIFILPGPFLNEPGFSGKFRLRVSSFFQGAELNATFGVLSCCEFQVDGIFGFKWIQLEESLRFKGDTESVFTGPLSFYNFKDHFKTLNNFFGGQLGLRARYCFQNWHLFGSLRVALGVNNQEVEIQGVTHTSDGNLFYATKNSAELFIPGGIFAQPTNHGSHNRQELSTIVETSLKGCYNICSQWELSVGYTFLWVNNMVRPGNQLDRKINPTTTALAGASRETLGVGPDTPVPFGGDAQAAPNPSGPKDPKVLIKKTNFWLQGLTLGLTYKF